MDYLNTAGAQGGGIVFLPVGTYYISGTLQIPPHTSLKGVAGNVYRSWGINASSNVGNNTDNYK